MMRLLILSLMFVIATPAIAQVTFQNAYDNLTFSSPMDFQFVEEIPDTVFVAERAGIIKQFHNSKTATSATTFLDIRSRVSVAGEGGLLGFAFHPNYTENGYLYAHYTRGSPFRSMISRFDMSDGAGTEVVLIELSQPYQNHNGGQIRFGPDGYLYIAFGDGGSGGDPLGHGQNRTTLHGNILRIDVDAASDGRNYGIPADNPFVGNTNGWREEIYAYGFRNPFRFSFDRETGELWVADVGQARREEVNIVEKGKNYGWNTMEGSLCYSPQTGCDQSGLELPIYEYGYSGSQSITGGFVYRGVQNPDLHGHYFFGDFTNGEVWSFVWDGEEVMDFTERGNVGGFLLTCFGEDHDGELYMCSFGGRMLKFDMGVSVSIESNGRIDDQPSGIQLSQNYPNPFNPSTIINYFVPDNTNSGSASQINLSVYDMMGREVMVLFNGSKPAGSHEAIFSGAGLSSGVYVYRLTVDNQTISRKMMLTK
jgi:glucose/arabinose dehydrogenase